MRKGTIILAAALGFSAGYIVRDQIQVNKKVSPEKALQHAKEEFKKAGPISGSWIYMKPEEIEKNGLVYNVYRGGITRTIDDKNKQYEFYTDVDTGTIISAKEAA